MTVMHVNIVRHRNWHLHCELLDEVRLRNPSADQLKHWLLGSLTKGRNNIPYERERERAVNSQENSSTLTICGSIPCTHGDALFLYKTGLSEKTEESKDKPQPQESLNQTQDDPHVPFSTVTSDNIHNQPELISRFHLICR